METHQYNPEFQSNFDMLDNRDKQGFFVRKLSFDGNFSPMNQFNENLEDYDLEFIMTRDKRCQEPQAPNVCYRKLCFGADNEKDDPFSSGIQPRDFNRDQIFGSNNDFSSAKRSLKKMFTPKRADTVHDFDMQSENSSSRRRGNLQTPENNLFMGVSRTNSQDMALQLGTTAVPEEEEEFEMELELDTPACFESTPQKTLPTCKNHRNPGLSSITPQTLVDLMAQNVNYIIIDCRYDYEYQGGHIKGAIHIDSPAALETLFITHRQFLYNKTIVDGIKEDPSLLNTPSHLYNYLQTDATEPCPPIVIFHCEFSQKRGPRGLRKLRDLDITINANNWPNVYYPEVYILDGGYRNFRTQFPGSCCPENSYVTMIDEGYKDRYYLARQQEKSTWGTSDDSKRKLGKMLGLQRAKTMFPY